MRGAAGWPGLAADTDAAGICAGLIEPDGRLGRASSGGVSPLGYGGYLKEFNVCADCDDNACSSHPEEGIFMTRVLRWCMLAGITAGLLGLTVPASGATGWTVVTPPASTAGAELTGSYALSDTDAWVVGGPANASAAPVALNWNGTAWSSVPTPTPSGSTPEWVFKSVAASSASDAWAVGEQVREENSRLALRTLERHGVVGRRRAQRRHPQRSPRLQPDERLGVRRLLRPALERDRVVSRFRCSPRPRGERGRPRRHLGRLQK